MALLTGGIASIINGALSGIFLDAVLVKDVAAVNSPDTNEFDPPAPTPTSYNCKAIVENYSQYYRANGFVQANDRKILILNKSLSVTPVPGDRIVIRSVTYTILDVMADPALATWECKAQA